MGALVSWLKKDARRSERRTCFDMAVAELHMGDTSCMILNRSALGMLLDFRDPVRPDLTFVLRDFAQGSIQRVRVVWCKETRVGVTLVEGAAA